MHIFLYVTLLRWLRMYVLLLASSARHLSSVLNLNRHFVYFLAVSGFEESNVWSPKWQYDSLQIKCLTSDKNYLVQATTHSKLPSFLFWNSRFFKFYLIHFSCFELFIIFTAELKKKKCSPFIEKQKTRVERKSIIIANPNFHVLTMMNKISEQRNYQTKEIYFFLHYLASKDLEIPSLSRARFHLLTEMWETFDATTLFLPASYVHTIAIQTQPTPFFFRSCLI